MPVKDYFSIIYQMEIISIIRANFVFRHVQADFIAHKAP